VATVKQDQALEDDEIANDEADFDIDEDPLKIPTKRVVLNDRVWLKPVVIDAAEGFALQQMVGSIIPE
jgi:hypothetical protein